VVDTRVSRSDHYDLQGSMVFDGRVVEGVAIASGVGRGGRRDISGRIYALCCGIVEGVVEDGV
jgi:hypothetical protein